MRLCLPYGMGLTSIFREFGVLIEGEAIKELLHTHTYDNQSLHHLVYRKIGGWWLHQASRQEVDSDLVREFEAGPSGATKAGSSKAPIDIASQPSKPTTPPAPAALDTSPQTLTAPQPNVCYDDQIGERIVSLVASSIWTQFQILSGKVDGLWIELHVLRTEMHDMLAQFRGRMESKFIEISVAIQ